MASTVSVLHLKGAMKTEKYFNYNAPLGWVKCAGCRPIYRLCAGVTACFFKPGVCRPTPTCREFAENGPKPNTSETRNYPLYSLISDIIR